MATSIQPRGRKFQLRVTHRLLQKPFFSTFDAEGEAETYRDQLVALLNRGIVPAELLAPAAKVDDPLVIQMIRDYTKGASLSDSEDGILNTLMDDVATLKRGRMTMQWADQWVRDMKVKANLAPGTIRKRVGALARVLDWYTHRNTPDGTVPVANVLRLLPRGYSVYSKAEADLVEATDKKAKRDISRERRLPASDEALIMRALRGEKRADRERALKADPAFELLFLLIIDTGLRLREAYTLRVDQVHLERRLLDVDGGKGHRGAIKKRFVPLKPGLVELLRPWCADRSGLLFPFWSGEKDELARTTGRLSTRFSKLFEYAGVEDLTEHDLRHEATCRWVTLRDAQGRWTFSDIEVCRIMGWTDTKLMLRYASLRGEDLADRLARK